MIAARLSNLDGPDRLSDIGRWRIDEDSVGKLVARVNEMPLVPKKPLLKLYFFNASGYQCRPVSVSSRNLSQEDERSSSKLVMTGAVGHEDAFSAVM